jgi:6-phosphogluconolactonase
MTVAHTTEFRTFETAEALAQGVAEWLCTLARAHERPFALCLSGGSTPKRLYETLATPAVASRFPWARTHLFWGDERFVPHNDPQSNYGMVRDAMLSRVPLPAANIHAVPTEGLSPEHAAAAYEATLKQFYRGDALRPDRPLFDVTLLGIGEDGHTASLFPREPALKESKRWVAPIDSAKYGRRITLTYPALDSSGDLAFLVAGQAKQSIVARVRSGDMSLPATAVEPIGHLHWFMDRLAAGAARV